VADYHTHPGARRGHPPAGHDIGLVRGVLAERVIVSTPLDPFMPLRALASYSGLSVTKLREYLNDPTYPLPYHRVGGKLLVRRSDFDAWVAKYRRVGSEDVAVVVDEVLRDVERVSWRCTGPQRGSQKVSQ
jgi:hypothetical protein